MKFSAINILNLIKEYNVKEIEEMCLTQIRIEESEKAGKYTLAKQKTAALNCLSKDKTRELLTHAWIEQEKQIICNGFLAIAFNEVQSYLPIQREDFKGEHPKLLQSITEAKNTITETIKAIEIKDIVIQQIATNKIENKVKSKAIKKKVIIPAIITLSEFRIGFNPEFMNNTICALGGYDKCSIGWPNKVMSPIFIESDEGIAIVLPVRIKEDITQ